LRAFRSPLRHDCASTTPFPSQCSLIEKPLVGRAIRCTPLLPTRAFSCTAAVRAARRALPVYFTPISQKPDCHLRKTILYALHAIHDKPPKQQAKTHADHQTMAGTFGFKSNCKSLAIGFTDKQI
jgi:hypothetical protein